MSHYPVLLQNVLEEVSLTPSSVVVDCTFGAGGYARAILEKLSKDGVYVGIDADQSAIDGASDLKRADATVHLVPGNFSELKQILATLDLQPDLIVADLGWRTEQFLEGGKGFSFQVDEPLLMTYGDPEQYLFTAYDIVNEWEEESIADVLYGYAEERQSRRIAKAIVQARAETPIKTSLQLAQIVSQSLPAVRLRQKTNPATKTFQALRIAVNDELPVLKTLLNEGFACLAPDGELAVVTFHSLEDRIVKHFFKEKVKQEEATVLFKKPITASTEELLENPRSRSAKLRIIKKV